MTIAHYMTTKAQTLGSMLDEQCASRVAEAKDLSDEALILFGVFVVIKIIQGIFDEFFPQRAWTQADHKCKEWNHRRTHLEWKLYHIEAEKRQQRHD